MTKFRIILILLVLGTLFGLGAARLLEANNPEHADAIVVLAGETQRRPERGLELLKAGYAPWLILDVNTQERVFASSLPEVAQRWVDLLPQRQQIFICPIPGLSTKEEAREADSCLQRFHVHNVLIVTSDFHTRRAVSIFQHELPKYHFSIAAAYNETAFGMAWWRHREWAKTTFYEWVRLAWWEAVDRWRG